VSVKSAYNSKVYYVITDGGGYGETVARFPRRPTRPCSTRWPRSGAFLPCVEEAHLDGPCHARRRSPPQILPIDWIGVHATAVRRPPIPSFPANRIYVCSDRGSQDF